MTIQYYGAAAVQVVNEDDLSELRRALAETSDRLASMQTVASEEESKRRQVEHNIGLFIALTGEVLNAKATANGLCSAYDDAIEQLNSRLEDADCTYRFPKREQWFDLSVNFVGVQRVNRIVRVQATSEEDARERMRAAIRGGKYEIEELLEADEEMSQDSIDGILTRAADDNYFEDVVVTLA